MFAYIMAPARRAGAGWGRQGPGAPPWPPPASPSPTWTCCGRVFSWTATGQRSWSRSWTCSVAATSSLIWKFSGKFQAECKYKFELSYSPCWPVRSCRPAALSSGLSHCDWQSLRSARGVRRADSDSMSVWLSPHCDWQMAGYVTVQARWAWARDVTARALIIEIQQYYNSIRRHCKQYIINPI